MFITLLRCYNRFVDSSNRFWFKWKPKKFKNIWIIRTTKKYSLKTFWHARIQRYFRNYHKLTVRVVQSLIFANSLELQTRCCFWCFRERKLFSATTQCQPIFFPYIKATFHSLNQFYFSPQSIITLFKIHAALF